MTSTLPQRRIGYLTATIIAINCIVSVAGIGWILFWKHTAGVVLYDYNFDAFHNVLSEAQGQAIIRCARDLVTVGMLPLIVANAVWLVLVLVLVRRLWKATA